MDTLTIEERNQLKHLITNLGAGVFEVQLITLDELVWILVGMNGGYPGLNSFNVEVAEEAKQIALLRRVFPVPVDFVSIISMDMFTKKFRQWKIEDVLANQSN